MTLHLQRPAAPAFAKWSRVAHIPRAAFIGGVTIRTVCRPSTRPR